MRAISKREEGVASPRQNGLLVPIETARVLQQTLEELDRVRRNLRQPFASKATVEAAIAKLESGLRAQSQDLLAAGYAAARQAQSHSGPSITIGTTFSPAGRKPLPPLQPSTQEKVALFKADPLNKPQTEAARAYLQERFGVAQPTKPHPTALPPAATTAPQGGQMAKGLTPAATPSVILPKTIRDDPYATAPTAVTDMDLHKGLLHLVNRGLIPAKADLSPALFGDAGAVRMGGASLHPPATQWQRPPPTSGLEDALLNAPAFKLDLLTPVHKPDQNAAKGAAGLSTLDLNTDPTNPTTKETASNASETDQPPVTSTAGGVARPFDMLMDTFSLHEFMIRKGCLVSETPEFESYHRTYEPLWPAIGPLIQQLEALAKQYALPLVVVDGRSLADLAHGVMNTGLPPQMQDLLVCIQNIQEVAVLLRQPGRRFLGVAGQIKAALTIQAAWRGYQTRNRYSRRGVAAASIQGAWRMHRLRQQLAEKLSSARKAREARYSELQQQLYSHWPLLSSTAHVVVHVPSMRRPQPSTLSQKDALLVAEAAQLARLTDLAEPLVEVLLLLPGPPNPDVIAYWDKILEVGGVPNASSRYRLVWPENHSRLPAHMSPAAMMMASPRALKRLRSAVAGRLGYIVPGMLGDEEVDLAVALGLPILAPAPHAARALCHKSAARAVFRAAGVNTAPGLYCLPRAKVPPPPARVGPNGVHPITQHTDFQFTEDGDIVIEEKPPAPGPPSQSQYEMDEERVLQVLSEAAVRWPWVRTWLIKVDDEVGGGAGHASFAVTSIQGAVEVLNRTALEEVGNYCAPHNGDLPELTEAQRVAVYRLSQLLYRRLPDKLTPAMREVYPTYRDYVTALATRGGVIEAVPDVLLGSPQVNLLIDPTGGVALLSTHEKIFVAPYRSVGTTFPQSSVHPRALLDAAISIGTACFQAGVVGHIAVDFVTLFEPAFGQPAASTNSKTASNHPATALGGGGTLKLWAVDVTPCATPSLMAFQLFDFLTEGSWDPLTGTYTVELQPPETDEEQLVAPATAQADSRAAAPQLQPAAAAQPLEDALVALHKPQTSQTLAPKSSLPHPASPPRPFASPPQINSSLCFLQDGKPSASTLPPPPLAPTLADPVLMDPTYRPSTADLPSGLPSPMQDSSPGSSRPTSSGYPSTTQQERLDHAASPGRIASDLHTPSSAVAHAATHPTTSGSARSLNTLDSHRNSTVLGTPLSQRRDGISDQPSTAQGQSDWLQEETASQASLAISELAQRAAIPPGSQRFFFALDSLSHPALAATPATRFFRSCWQEGLHYDVDERLGVIFNLSDKYLLGTLAVVAVGLAPHHIMATMQQVLSFISAREREAGGPLVSGQNSRASDSVIDIKPYLEIQALVRYMADKSTALMAAAGVVEPRRKP